MANEFLFCKTATGIYIESFYRNSDTMFTFTINRILHTAFIEKTIKDIYKRAKDNINRYK